MTTLHVKTKGRGGIYLKLKSDPDEVSVVTIKTYFVGSKTKIQKPKAGGKGQLTYQLLDSKTA